MRIKLYLALLFILGSVLVYQSTSFTSAEITNETGLLISPEEVALIAITYGEGRSLFVTNNTEKPISMENVGNIALEGNFSFFLQPGSTEPFLISNVAEEVSGGSIRLIANWEGGKAEINSDIPQSNIEFILLELAALEMGIIPVDSIELLESEEVESDLVEGDKAKMKTKANAVKTVEAVEEVINDVETPTEKNDKTVSVNEETAPETTENIESGE